MNLRNPIHRMIAARVAGALAAATVAFLFAWTASATDRWWLRGAFAALAAAFVYCAFRAGGLALHTWRRTRRCPSEPVPASPEIWAAYMAVVERARQIEADGHWRAYQRVCEKYWDDDVEEAGGHARALVRATGRYDAAWRYIDELCGIVGGASDVASAVLVRDVIDPRDFELLTEWWVKAGLPLEPHPAMTSTSPAGR